MAGFDSVEAVVDSVAVLVESFAVVVPAEYCVYFGHPGYYSSEICLVTAAVAVVEASFSPPWWEVGTLEHQHQRLGTCE